MQKTSEKDQSFLQMFFTRLRKRGLLFVVASQIVHNYYALMNTNAISSSKVI
jgi:DUF1009 family protein